MPFITTSVHFLQIVHSATTGSTANACAKALLEAGADKVAVLTVLRG